MSWKRVTAGAAAGVLSATVLLAPPASAAGTGAAAVANPLARPGGPAGPPPETPPGVDDLDGRLVLDDGHVDVLSIHLTDGNLQLQLNDDTRQHHPDRVLRTPDEVVLHAVPQSRIELPDWVADFPPWQVLGSPGDVRWHFPDSQQQGILWPGWSTETIPDGTLAGDEIDLVMTGFSGPGDLIMAHIDSSGMLAPPLWDTREPLPQTVVTGSRTHTHANWYFTEPGIYRVTWQAEATLAAGAQLVSDPADYLFVVDQWPSGDSDGDSTSSQLIVASIDADHGGLTLSVDPDDRTVELPAAELSGTADRLSTIGDLRPVTVTDTRAADPGWHTSAQVSDFTAGGGEFSGGHLGWTPAVQSQSDSQQVQAGSAVPGLLDGGPGLATSHTLAAAAAGAGTGTSVLGAQLRLDIPTETPPGTYTALITLTAI